MAIQFGRDDWARITETYEKWWAGALERPLMRLEISNAFDAKRPEPETPALSQRNCHLLDIPAEDVIDAVDWKLSRTEYLGDSFPMVNFDAFGPGVLAAMCGARLDNSTGSVWFHAEPKEPDDIEARYDPGNVWTQRIKDLYRAADKRWNGAVALGMPDLGGVMDIAATLRGTQNLLTDLIDDPDSVDRLRVRVENAWMDAYTDLYATQRECSPVCTHWSGLASRDTSYIIQSDFSYMLGPAMFRRFVKPSLERSTNELTRTIYHLDGPGELKHLGEILEMDGLNAVQWVHGSGNKPSREWPEVYAAIAAKGKRILLEGGPDDYRAITPLAPHGLAWRASFPLAERDTAIDLMREAGLQMAK